MNTFKPNTTFHGSWLMGKAQATESHLIALLGEGEEDCDKSDREWRGTMIASDGTEVHVAAWDWKGGMRLGYGVSIWCSQPAYLHEWKAFLEKKD